MKKVYILDNVRHLGSAWSILTSTCRRLNFEVDVIWLIMDQQNRMKIAFARLNFTNITNMRILTKAAFRIYLLTKN